jgi:hypothetical protein
MKGSMRKAPHAMKRGGKGSRRPKATRPRKKKSKTYGY